jgi:hypothetical protein
MQELAGIQSEIKVNIPGLSSLKEKLINIISLDREGDEDEENSEMYSLVIDDIKSSNTKEELLNIMSNYLHDYDLAKQIIEI